MNDIITPVTKDGEVGFDQFGQFVSWQKHGDGMVGTHIADVRQKTCLICKRGWELTGPGLRDQFQIRSPEAWVHKTCYVGFLTVQEGMMIYEALSDSTMALYEQAVIGWRTQTIANEYGGAWDTPWYQFAIIRYPKDSAKRQNHFGDVHSGDATGFCIKFGPRKRVYHLALHRPDFNFSRFHPITEDNVTKEVGPGYLMVHAWTPENVKKYLAAMLKIVVENTSEP